MKFITILLLATAVSAAPIVDFPNNKELSEKKICGTWMLKTNEKVTLKYGDMVFKPNVEYSTSSLIGQDGKLTISNTDEVFEMQDFYNMMNYDGDKFIIWSINGSFKFYNCMKQDDINVKLANQTFISLDKDISIDVRGCLDNIDCININCKDMVYVKDMLSCYPLTPGKTLGYYINANNDW